MLSIVLTIRILLSLLMSIIYRCQCTSDNGSNSSMFQLVLSRWACFHGRASFVMYVLSIVAEVCLDGSALPCAIIVKADRHAWRSWKKPLDHLDVEGCATTVDGVCIVSVGLEATSLEANLKIFWSKLYFLRKQVLLFFYALYDGNNFYFVGVTIVYTFETILWSHETYFFCSNSTLDTTSNYKTKTVLNNCNKTEAISSFMQTLTVWKQFDRDNTEAIWSK